MLARKRMEAVARLTEQIEEAEDIGLAEEAPRQLRLGAI